MSAPTITGTIKNITDAEFSQVDVLFESVNAAAFFVGSVMICEGRIHVRTQTDGTLPAGVALAPGDYKMTVNNSAKNSVLIRVPNDTAAHNYFDIIISAISSPGIPVGGTAPVATATVSGTVKTNTTSGTPIVYLKSEVDTLIAAIPTISSLFWKNGRSDLQSVNSSLIATNAGAILGPGSSDGLFARWYPADTAADNGGTIMRPTDNPAAGRWHLF